MLIIKLMEARLKSYLIVVFRLWIGSAGTTMLKKLIIKVARLQGNVKIKND